MNIAIIGGGVSGLVAAHLLHKHHLITVFEAGDYAGGHTNTVDVEASDGRIAVDTGFIAFNDRNYPNFERLLRKLGVAAGASDMSFSVSDGKGDFEYASTSISGLYANRSHFVKPWFQKMVADVVRFQRQAPRLLRSDDNPSLGHWLEQQRYSRAFIDKLIVPQAAAVWSSDPSQMWSFPARFLVEFFDNHGMLGLRNRPNWLTVKGGSQRYVEAMTSPWIDRIRLSTSIERVQRSHDHVEVTPRGGRPERFDAVVFGAHSDQALAMLADPTRAERKILGAFPYQPNEAILHTDRSMLPARRAARASWNYHLLDEPIGKPAVTYDMNRLQALQTRDQFCVTLNRTEQIDPAKILKTFAYTHPVYTHAGQLAQHRHADISTSENRTHYCGAYWGWGFHEDGVASALRVAGEFGVPGL
jgi:predicted NAD/FAD-binding protein